VEAASAGAAFREEAGASEEADLPEAGRRNDMMELKASELFSTEDKEAISGAIKKAEAYSSGEIAIMVVDSSDSYREAETLGAFILSGFFSLLIEIALGYLASFKAPGWNYNLPAFNLHLLYEAAANAAVWTYIPAVFVLYFPFRFLLSKYPEFKILFVSGVRIEETVRERAVTAFYEKQLYKTRDETGVLIFISLLEHRVWILGDRGINEKISPDFWSKIAAGLSSGMKKKEYGKAVCGAIADCGNELSKHFPKKADDTNELTDQVFH
jgi:putative membrane protein